MLQVWTMEPCRGGSMVAADFACDEEAMHFLRISRGEDGKPPPVVVKIFFKVMRIVAVVVLLPLRMICFFATVSVLLLLYRISICLGPRTSGLSPHTKAQSAVLWMTTPVWRLILFFFGIVWIRVQRPKGVPRWSAANTTVVANHVTMLDSFMFGYLLGAQVTGVAMDWVAKAPIASTIGRAHKVLSVKRDGRANQALSEIKVAPEEGAPRKSVKSSTDTIIDYQRSCAADPRLLRLLIFPEGTTKASRCLLKFRTGGFASGEPVQPVALRYPASMGWCDGVGGHWLDLMTRWAGVCDVTILPTYVPNAEERADPTLYAGNVHKVIAEALALPPERCSMTVGAKEIVLLTAARNA